MCGRFTVKMTWSEIVALYKLTLDRTPHNLPPRYNVCPSDRRNNRARRQNLAQRIEQLQAAAAPSIEVLLVKRGSVITERAFHRRFRTQRIRRELFRLEGALADFITREQARTEGQNQASESPPVFVRITGAARGD
jgi:hypothetical protein